MQNYVLKCLFVVESTVFQLNVNLNLELENGKPNRVRYEPYYHREDYRLQSYQHDHSFFYPSLYIH